MIRGCEFNPAIQAGKAVAADAALELVFGSI